MSAAIRLALRRQISGTASVPATTSVPPPPLVAVEQPEPIKKGNCSICHVAVTNDCDRMVRGACEHVAHVSCMMPFLLAGRQYCMQCPLARTNEEAVANEGYSIDAGSDLDVRESIAAALEYRRSQVRDERLAQAKLAGECQKYRYHISLFVAHCSTANLTIEEEHELFYANLPLLPGGVPIISQPGRDENRETAAAFARKRVAVFQCKSETCGGEAFCVHKYMAPISTDAAWHWRRYDAAVPSSNPDWDRARAAVKAILAHRAPPSDWARCGADAERLAVMGYTIENLVMRHNVVLEDIVSGLNLNWKRLVILGFKPELLRHHDHFPIVVLAKAGLTATRLLRLGAMSYKTLNDFALSHEELRYIGFDAPLLIQLGMTGEDMLDALSHEHVRVRGVEWWANTMRCNRELVTHAFRNMPPVSHSSLDDRVTYVLLVTASNAVKL